MAPLWYRFRRKTCLGKLGVGVGMLSLGGAAAVFLPAGAAAGLGVAVTAAAANIIGGVGGNLFSSCMDRWFPEHSLDPSEKLNHDIELVVGHAVQGVMRELIKRGSPHASLYEHLLKHEVADAWHKLMIEFDLETALDIPDPQQLLLLAAEARETGNGDKLPPCLDKDTWRLWLVRLAPRMQGSKAFGDSEVVFTDGTTQTSLDELAPALVKRFYWHVVEALKADFEQDGKAYAAIQMQTAASTLVLVRAQSKGIAALHLTLDKIEDYIINKANTIAVAGGLNDEEFKFFQDEFADLHVKLDSLLRLAEQMVQNQKAQTLLAQTNAQLVTTNSGLAASVGHLVEQSERHRLAAASATADRDRIYAQLQEAQRRADAGDETFALALAQAWALKSIDAVVEALRPPVDRELSRIEAQRAVENQRRAVENERIVTASLSIIDHDLSHLAFARAQTQLQRLLDITGDRFDLLARLARIHLTLLQLNNAIAVLRRAGSLVANDWHKAYIACEIGDIQRVKGDRMPARTSYAESLKIRRRIVTQFGETPQALRDVSVSLNKVGDVERAESGPKAALPFYAESLEICRRIVTQFGETPEALRDVSVSLNKVGDVERAESGPKAALPFYAESLEICRRIVTQFGETPEALRDVSVSLNKVGDVERAESGPKAALPFYAESLEIRRRIVTQFGETPEALRDVSVSLDRVGDVEGAESGPKAALPFYAESLEICRRIVTQFGETPQALRDVSVSLDRVGDVERAESGPKAALPFYAESLEIRRRIVTQFGETPQALRDVSVSLQRTGLVQAMSGDKAAGLADVRAALRGFEDVGRRWGLIPQIVADIESTKKLIAANEAS